MNTNELEAGRELDALICERVMGQTFERDDRNIWLVDPDLLPHHYEPVPAYSTDIGAAWGVVTALRTDGWYVTVREFPGQSVVDVTCPRGPCPKHGNPHHDWHGVEGVSGLFAPLAICRAALLAVGHAPEAGAAGR